MESSDRETGSEHHVRPPDVEPVPETPSDQTIRAAEIEQEPAMNDEEAIQELTHDQMHRRAILLKQLAALRRRKLRQRQALSPQLGSNTIAWFHLASRSHVPPKDDEDY